MHWWIRSRRGKRPVVRILHSAARSTKGRMGLPMMEVSMGGDLPVVSSTMRAQRCANTDTIHRSEQTRCRLLQFQFRNCVGICKAVRDSPTASRKSVGSENTTGHGTENVIHESLIV